MGVKKGSTWTQAQRDAHKNIKRSDETRRRMSEAKTGVSRDEETKQKISEGKLRYTFTEEHIQHIRESNKPSIPKVCLSCGKEYIGKKGQKYCCTPCGQKYRKARRMLNDEC